MKKLSSLIAFLIILATHSFSQEMDCKKFHEGKFSHEDKVGLFESIRKDDMQIEKAVANGQYVEAKYTVKWLEECVYELTLIETNYQKMNEGPQIFLTKITEIQGDTYFYEMQVEGNKMPLTSSYTLTDSLTLFKD